MPDNQVPTCFIDTNIWLYAFIEGDDLFKSATARRLIQKVEPQESEEEYEFCQVSEIPGVQSTAETQDIPLDIHSVLVLRKRSRRAV